MLIAGNVVVLLWSICLQHCFVAANLEACSLILGSFPFCYWFVSFSFSRKQSSFLWILMFNSWPEGMGSGSQLLDWAVVHSKELHRMKL